MVAVSVRDVVAGELVFEFEIQDGQVSCQGRNP